MNIPGEFLLYGRSDILSMKRKLLFIISLLFCIYAYSYKTSLTFTFSDGSKYKYSIKSSDSLYGADFFIYKANGELIAKTESLTDEGYEKDKKEQDSLVSEMNGVVNNIVSEIRRYNKHKITKTYFYSCKNSYSEKWVTDITGV